MFVHADMLGPQGVSQQTIPMHLIGNMFVLFFLGAVVEQVYGSGRFTALYFGSGLIAAISQASIDPFTYLVGASGAISGVMAAFVRHFPNARLYLYGILPVRAWILMAAWLLYNIYGSTAGADLQTAFVAHLAGFAAGMIMSYAFFPPRKVLLNEFRDRR
jgi:membrane associated rhomboid family serine protease